MEMGMLSCFVILLLAVAHVDARFKVEPVSTDEGDKFTHMDNLTAESICDSCLKPSRTEEISRELKLFEKLGMISTEVCHIMPSDFKDKCLETSDAYVHRTKLLVNGVFNEQTLCNSTGLCLWKSMFLVINGLASVSDEEPLLESELSTKATLPIEASHYNGSIEVNDENTCTACRRSVREIFVQLNKPKMRMRVMESLIEYCEEAEYNERECKQKIYKYAPLALSKLEKIKTSDFCRLMGFCDEGML